MEREPPPRDAGTQERLKGRGGTRILRKIIWKTSAYPKPKVTLEKFEVHGTTKVPQQQQNLNPAQTLTRWTHPLPP